MNEYSRKQLTAEKVFDVRFSEVDSMSIVWHGSYALYFEDAREEFGRKYNLEYLTIFENGFYAPLVELHFDYKKPLKYQESAKVVISYRPVDAAKLIFDYAIYSLKTNELVATGYSVQVFLDRNHQLSFATPEFFLDWKRKNGVL